MLASKTKSATKWRRPAAIDREIYAATKGRRVEGGRAGGGRLMHPPSSGIGGGLFLEQPQVDERTDERKRRAREEDELVRWEAVRQVSILISHFILLY